MPIQYKYYIFFSFLFFCFTISGQNIDGRWEGIVQQKNSEDIYIYSLEVSIDGQAASGVASSKLENGTNSAAFIMSGIWDGQKLLLQEVKQTSPYKPKWCLKSINLDFLSTEEGLFLKGDWTAKNCKPGSMNLKKISTFEMELEEKPFTIIGNWRGHLSQSDRDYGFFYEITFEKGGKGWSKIISEGEGGTAKHSLTWTYAEQEQLLSITEREVIERTNPKWKWCIKSGELKMQRNGMGFILQGDWAGHIENKNSVTGACAPGIMILEKPVITQTTKKEIDVISKPYENKYHRKVKIGRTVEVSNKDIKIKIWDSGTVDGDYATLFLNGKRILNNYKVRKYKKGILVELNEEENVLILHAEDLGDIPPNTVAVSIVDGKKETMIVMNSNLKESDAILIRRFKIKD